MSETQEEKLAEDIVRAENMRHEGLREKYIEGEITEEEYEEAVSELLESGDEFIDYEESTTSKVSRTSTDVKEKLQYYSLPLTVIAMVTLLFLTVPAGAAFNLAPVALGLALLLWGLGKIYGLV